MDAFDSAISKIDGHIQYENLPRRYTDPLWDDVRKECGLTLNEMNALKNDICYQVPSVKQREQRSNSFDIERMLRKKMN